MTDYEMRKICAKLMEYDTGDGEPWVGYNPLIDDHQAMALVKRFRLTVEDEGLPGGDSWWVYGLDAVGARSADLNLAIVSCVAQMQLERTKPAQSGGQSEDKPLTKVE